MPAKANGTSKGMKRVSAQMKANLKKQEKANRNASSSPTSKSAYQKRKNHNAKKKEVTAEKKIALALNKKHKQSEKIVKPVIDNLLDYIMKLIPNENKRSKNKFKRPTLKKHR